MRDCRAFTLIEILVVVGIIGVLLAILLPVLSSARGGARALACAAQQREVAAAYAGHATEHDGYGPLLGDLVLPGGTEGYGSLPIALADPRRGRYDYLPDRDVKNAGGQAFNLTLEQVWPLPAALDPYIGGAGDLRNVGRADVVSYVDEFPVAHKMMTCPESDNSDLTAEGNSDATAPRREAMRYWFDAPGRVLNAPSPYFVTGDYAFNEAVTGFHHDSAYDRFRARGRLTSVASASETVLAGEFEWNGAGWITTWSVALPPADPVAPAPPTGPVAVSAALGDWKSNDVLSVPVPPPSLDRHGGRMNAVFADGHVATLDRAGLSTAWLVPPTR